MSDSLLDIENLSVPRALHSLSIRVAAGEAVALVGANGAGKSTLLRAVMGLAPASAGTIRFEGRDLSGLTPNRRARLGIGYAPEGRRVFPGMSVKDNLLVACPGKPAERLDRVHRLFPTLAERAATPAWQLSGGQQQMLAIGRALMLGPKLLLLDEPSLGLAPLAASEVLALVRDIAREGIAVLLAEQNIRGALSHCSRAYGLKLGRVVAEGGASSFLTNPELGRLLF